MSIRYSDYVKRPFEEHGYLPEQILELSKCSNNIKPFLKHVIIVHPDRGKIEFKPYKFQKIILKTVKDNRFTVALCSRQSGKCVHSDSPITIRNKNTGEIEKITIGGFFNFGEHEKRLYISDKKFTEIYNTTDYEVLTNTGWKEFDGIGETVPYQVYEVILENNLSLKCADTHILMNDDNELFVENISIGDIVDTSKGKSPVKKIIKHNEHVPMYDLMNVDGSVYYTNDILSHNTTVVSIYALWYAIFHDNKNIGIVSNKEKSAISILTRLKEIYEELPAWLKPGVKQYNKMSVHFDNGSKIFVSTTSADAFRGEPLNLLLADELAFVPKGIADDFWAANYPTISASKEAKIIVISTPNGMFNLFHRLYSEAENKINDFVALKSTWKDVPGRDKAWAKQQLKNIGKVKFAQEFSCEFLGSTNTVIDSEVLSVLFTQYQEPILIELENKFRIYEKPIEHTQYLIGVDTAKGTGEHFSTMQVLKVITSNPIKLAQVAVYESNLIDVYSFTDIIHRTGIFYNNAYVIVENNAEGAAVVNKLWWELEYTNMVNSGSKISELGVRATKTTKTKAVLLMKKLIEDNNLSLIDLETINQLGSYIEKNKKMYGKDLDDDLVSGLYWSTYIFLMDILDETVSLETKSVDDEGWGLLSSVTIEEDNFDWLLEINN